jgi:hypothetical protein
MTRAPGERLKRRKYRWEKDHPGEIYPGPFTAEMRSALNSGVNNPFFGKCHTDESRNQQRETVRHGIKDEDCPTIVPGSRTEQVIIGSLLGDGSIHRGRFGEKHAFKQREMVFELARILEPLFAFKEELYGRPLTRIKTPKNKDNPVHLTNTSRYPIFHEMEDLWYPNKNIPGLKKRVPDGILDKIGPQTLAWWYMGDGTYAKVAGNVRFSSRGFPREDNEKLVGILVGMGFNSTKVTNSNYIRLDHGDTLEFLPMIAEYVVPCVRESKLGPLEPTYKPYNPHHYDPEPIVTERMLKEKREITLDSRS